MKAPRPIRKTAWKAIWALAAVALLLGVLPPPATRADETEEENKNLRDKRYFYQAFNRRDPFQSLIAGEFEQTEFDLVDVNAVRLVGVLTGGMERYAMLEDKNGFAYIVKAGDPVRNGNVVSIGERTLVARISMFGQTNSITLHLEGEDRTKGDS
ncbi:MAG: hypothetical protein PHQ19_03450 [Candidatus Krumholzibacteria bacterium]|nr:hypothetical protein [Candidatus Krumholzibacteria bacterium]